MPAVYFAGTSVPLLPPATPATPTTPTTPTAPATPTAPSSPMAGRGCPLRLRRRAAADARAGRWSRRSADSR
ncbi:hypothetical protein FLW53_01185 [Microbispora sp. SCL1-1]|nr:hypothetical protein FLW53_01185 [Microbispora sp. SCL1-1]